MIKKSWYYFLTVCCIFIFLCFVSPTTAAFGEDAITVEKYRDKVYAKANKPEPSVPLVELEAYNNTRDELCNTISPWFRLYNTGTSDIKLSEVQIIYYYTAEGEAKESFWCDWSSVGSSKVTGSFAKMSTPMIGADSYIQIGFKNGAKSIKSGEYVELQCRYAKSDWSNYNQLNDYSFNCNSDDFAVWDKATVYVNNALIWGTEPQSPAPTPIPVKKIEIEMCNTKVHEDTKTLYPRYILSNTGNVPINLQDVRIRYYYTIDGNQEQNFWCDWSNVGSSNVIGNFVKLSEPIEKADTYLEIGFKSGAGVIKPGSKVDIHTRMAKTDWTKYNQTNDYSYTYSKHDYIIWDKVTAFIGDEMVWGDQTLFGKPLILLAEAQENSIQLLWSPVEGATGYDAQDNGTVVDSVYSNSYRHIGLPAGTFHSYRIRATSSMITGSWSDTYDIWTLPDIPCGIVTEATENDTNISWDQVTGATGYDIEVDGILFENVESPFINSNLQPGTIHYYRIRAKNSSGCGKWTEIINKWTIPDKVTMVNSYATQTVIVAYWDDVIGATAYDIEFDGRMLEEPLSIVSVTDLKPGTLHRYRVRAKNESGAGVWSEEYSYWTVPDIVTSIFSSASESQIDISWDDVIGATDYDIEVDGEIFKDQPSPYMYTDLESGTRHTFRIRAKNSSGIGYWNESFEVWTLPGSVEGIEAQGMQNTIFIQWEPVRGASSYEVKQGDTITEIPSSPFIHEGLIPGTLYNYLIRAKNSSGTGVWSDEVSLWTIPDKVNDTTIEATETEIEVFWNEVTGATGYDIEVDGVLFEDVSSPYIHQGLLEGTKHIYKLRAKNSSGYGFWNDELVKWTLPAVAENITILSGETYLAVEWDEVTGATGYDIKIDDIQLDDVTNPQAIQNLSPGTEYVLMVRAKNTSGLGKWSDGFSVWTIPDIVKILNMNASQTCIEIQWENATGATGYDIKIGEQLLNDVESPFLYQNAQPGTEYFISVRAKNSGGIGRWCDEQSIWTLPDIPENIITEPTSSSVRISWDPVIGATGYDIEVYGTAVDAGAQGWYIHDGLNSNNQQTYRVRAKNSSGDGDWSSIVAETTLPGIPSYIRTEANDKKIIVYWDAMPGALTYDIEVDGVTHSGLSEPKYEHKQLQPNTIHSYRLRSTGINGTSDWSSLEECSTLFSPPENIDFTLTSTQIQLTWNTIEGAAGYDVEIDGQIYNNDKKTNFIHTGLTPDSQHIYRVRAKNNHIEGIWSQPLTKSTLLAAPENIQGKSSGTQITVNWGMVAGATSYDIEADGLILQNGLSIQFQHTGLETFSAHLYRVRAWNREGAGEWSEPANFYTLVGTPKNISTVSTSSEINVKWDTVSGATGYEIMIDGNIYDNGNSTTYKHIGVEPNSMHIYQVRSKRDTDTSEWSEAISVRALVGIPANLACLPKSRSLEIVWDEVNGATNYDVEINGDIVANASKTSHTHLKMEPNTSYMIRIRAKNELGNGEWSSYIECNTAPDIPAGLSATETTSEVNLFWDNVEGAIFYDLEVDGIVIKDITGTEYLHSGLKSNTRHIYRIRSKNEHTTSDWSDSLTQLTTPEVAVPTQKDTIFNFVIVAPQKAGQNECIITVTYNPEELEVFDLCALTPEPETKIGDIDGTNISVLEFSNGRIVYKIRNANRTVVQIIKFLSNTSGHSKVTYTIQ